MTTSQALADSPIRFEEARIAEVLEGMTEYDYEQLPFGVIGFDDSTRVVIYNRFEASAAAMMRDHVLGQLLFKVVAPCVDNALVAGRFDDAQASDTDLDVIIPYVLTLRMRPVKVRLRLVAGVGSAFRYVLVERRV